MHSRVAARDEKKIMEIFSVLSDRTLPCCCCISLWAVVDIVYWLACQSTVSDEELDLYKKNLRKKPHVRARLYQNSITKMFDKFKLGWISIRHLNHHKNSSDLNHFENVQFENQNFWCTSYKWMCANSYRMDITKTLAYYTNKSEFLHVSSLNWIEYWLLFLVFWLLMYGV